MLGEVVLFLDPARKDESGGPMTRTLALLATLPAGLALGLLSLLFSDQFLQTIMIEFGVSLVICGLVAAAVYYARHRLSNASESLTRLILIVSWYIFILLVIISSTLYAFKKELGLTDAQILLALVLGNSMQILALVTVLGVFIHIVLNFSEEYRTFIILKEYVTEALKPLEVQPDDNSIIAIMEHLGDGEGQLSLSDYEKILLEEEHLKIEDTGAAFMLVVKPLMASQGIEVMDSFIHQLVVESHQEVQAFENIQELAWNNQQWQAGPLLKKLRVGEPSKEELDRCRISVGFKAVSYNDRELRRFWGRVWIGLTHEAEGRRAMDCQDFKTLMFEVCRVSDIGPPLSPQFL